MRRSDIIFQIVNRSSEKNRGDPSLFGSPHFEEVIKTTSNRYGKCKGTNNCGKRMDCSIHIDNRMDTRHHLGSSNIDLVYRSSLDSCNRKRHHPPIPPRCRDNHRGSIHYQKPNWEEARPALCHDPIVHSKLVLPAVEPAIAIRPQISCSCLPHLL